jgi:hypothetical protein
LSKNSKEYILNLDIEKDARLLKERLNICGESLDYFCAASSILKAGVKAGLTLYDIAVMCCRNDNLGEIPSKLEVLFSMAAELAESAIENGRWHHAAASRALEEQLTPTQGGSLISSSLMRGKGFPKAMSAANLSQYSHGLVEFAGESKPNFVPGMIQSSASDSSSDAGEVDPEDCEEWAANLIADVSLDKSMSLIGTKARSASIESDNSSDSGSEGFWHIRPGSSLDPSDVDASDEDSISWSPPNSPMNLPELPPISSFSEEMRKSYNPFENGRRASIVMPELPSDLGDSFKQFRSPTKVSFADHSRPAREEQESKAKFKHSNSDVVVGFGEPIKSLKRPESKMKRSQSYSALSSTTAENIAAEEETAKMSRPIDHEQYRDYFLKFIDLVIVRETTAASRQAKQKSS